MTFFMLLAVSLVKPNLSCFIDSFFLSISRSGFSCFCFRFVLHYISIVHLSTNVSGGEFFAGLLEGQWGRCAGLRQIKFGCWQKNKQVKAVPKDREFERKFKLQQKRKKHLWKRIMHILQPNLGSCSHIMAPAAISWLLQSHIGFCIYIFALEVIY